MNKDRIIYKKQSPKRLIYNSPIDKPVYSLKNEILYEDSF